jgi:hypothetical protein
MNTNMNTGTETEEAMDMDIVYANVHDMVS